MLRVNRNLQFCSGSRPGGNKNPSRQDLVDAPGKISDNTLLEYESVGTSCKAGFDIILIFQSAQEADNVGTVKQFLSTLPHALRKARYFALDEKAFQPRLACNRLRSGLSV